MAEGLYKKSVDDSITPDLPGKNSRAAEKAAAEEAKTRLRNGEDAVSGSDGGSGNLGAAGLENGGFYAGAGGAVALDPRSARGGRTKGGKGKFRKYGPILGIMMAIFGGAGAVGAVQSLMPFHVTELFTEMGDGSFTSRTHRMSRIMKNIANMDGKADQITKKHLASNYKKYRKGIKKYKNKLEKQGIEVKTEGRKTVLEWTSRTGKKTKVTADDFGSFYKGNTEFRNDFNRGTRSLTGRIAAWIDLSAARFFKSHSLTKNLWKDWQNKTIQAEGENMKFKDIIKGRRPDVDVEVGSSKTKTEEIRDRDGNIIGYRHSDDPETATTKTKTKNGFTDGLTKVASGIQNIGCMKAAVATAAVSLGWSMLKDAAQNSWQATAEATDKVKAGDGANAPIHDTGKYLSNKLTAQGMISILSGGTISPTQNESLASLNMSNIFSSVEYGVGVAIACTVAKVAIATVSIVTSVMGGGLVKAFFGIGKEIAVNFAGAVFINMLVENYMSKVTNDSCLDSGENNDDPTKVNEDGGNCLAIGGLSVLQDNFRSGGGTLGSIAKASDFYEAHQIALKQEAEYDRATRSPFDATNGNTFLGSIVQSSILPVAQLTHSPAGFISSIGGLLRSSLTSLLPSASAISKTEYLANQIGECPLAESIGAIGNAIDCSPIIITDMSTIDIDPEDIMDDIVDENTGIVSNFEMNGDEIAVDENGVEKIKDGSNLSKYINYCSRRESPFGVIDQNIISAETTAQADTGNNLADMAIDTVIGAVPVIGDVVDFWNGLDELNALQWATGANCVARDANDTQLLASAENVGSGNVLGRERRNGNESYAYNGCITYLAQHADAAIRCDGYEVSISDVPYDTLSWKEVQLYQRYVEDDRLIQSVDDEDQHSAVENYIARYEEEHPVDNSFEGVLARRTGMLKEDVVVALNEIQYWEYLADYEPSDLYPVPVEREEMALDFRGEKIELPEMPEVKLAGVEIIYAPLREKNHAA